MAIVAIAVSRVIGFAATIGTVFTYAVGQVARQTEVDVLIARIGMLKQKLFNRGARGHMAGITVFAVVMSGHGGS